MKKIVLFALLISSPLCAQTGLPGTPTTGTSTPQSGIPQSTTPNAPNAQKAPPPKKEEEQPIKPPPKITAPQEIDYLSPGVIVSRTTGWAGGDNLLNVGANIPIHVEIVSATGKASPILEGVVKKRVAEIFSRVGISNQIQAYTDKPPLPFFHVLIMVQEIEKGYATYVAGRLFEQVDVPRVSLNDQTFFQAITWEKQDLIIASPQEIQNQAFSVLDQIAQNFADRYTYFENIKRDMIK